MQKPPQCKRSLADLMGFVGLIFFGQCSKKLLEIHEVGSAFMVLGILTLWMIGCLFILRKQNRV